jgi:hypothetical protein
MPRATALPGRLAVLSAAVHCWAQAKKFAEPEGIDIVGVFRVTPAGGLPKKTMSVSAENRLTLPLPTFASKKAIVLLVPSGM